MLKTFVVELVTDNEAGEAATAANDIIIHTIARKLNFDFMFVFFELVFCFF